MQYRILPHIGRQDLHVDLCFVGDLVHGILAAADHPAADGEVFFLGGSSHTWRELGGEIARQMDVHPREIVFPRGFVLACAGLADLWARLRQQPSLLGRANVLERLRPFWLCDSSKAQQMLGYAPRTALAQGIAETLLWYQKAAWL